GKLTIDKKILTNDTTSNAKTKNNTVVSTEFVTELAALLCVVKEATELIDHIDNNTRKGSITNDEEKVYSLQVQRNKYHNVSLSNNMEDNHATLVELYHGYMDEYELVPSANYLLKFARQRGAKVTYAQVKDFMQNLTLLDRIHRNSQLKRDVPSPQLFGLSMAKKRESEASFDDPHKSRPVQKFIFFFFFLPPLFSN
ncbi:hypothetical protein RFI_35780, partial [Reticulomyxa filosa]